MLGLRWRGMGRMAVVVDMQREEGMEVAAGVEVLAEQECWVGEQETVYPQLHGSCGGLEGLRSFRISLI
jgi:hypothetical protein